MFVRPKKHLGQHFLTDQSVAQHIVAALEPIVTNVLEVGPGMGVLTQYLIKRDDITLKAVEIDSESVIYLRENYAAITPNLYEEDFLKLDLKKIYGEQPFSVIGNFPYNISSQIFFKILDYKDSVPQVVCMIQKEVAERIAAKEGSKTYGILSVLLQLWYNIDYLFTVGEGAFLPPPKVKSAVIRLSRNDRKTLPCDENLLKQVVKAGFNQRRKTLRNSLKQICDSRGVTLSDEFAGLRPEQLSVEDFIKLTQSI